MSTSCWFLLRWYHTWQRYDDRRSMTLRMICTFPDVFDRMAAWKEYMSWPTNTHWHCACSREAKHPMNGIPLKDLQ